MKKTLITLLALGSIACGDMLTLGSKLSYVDSTDASNSFTIDAYQAFVGKTRDEIDGYTLSGVDCIDADRVNTIPGTSTNTITLNLGDMISTGTAELGEGLQLTQISFIGRDASDRKPAEATLSLELDGSTYTSSVAQSGGDTTHEYITFSFTDGPIITCLSDIQVTYSASTATLGSGVFKAQNGAVLSGVNNGSTDWTPIAQVVLSTPSIPEPTTATLSLLALAGLAVRRRRK